MVRKQTNPLRQLRGKWTLEFVAGAIGADVSWLSRLERNLITHPRYDLVTKLAEFYGIEVDDVYRQGRAA